MGWSSMLRHIYYIYRILIGAADLFANIFQTYIIERNLKKEKS